MRVFIYLGGEIFLTLIFSFIIYILTFCLAVGDFLDGWAKIVQK